MRASGAGSVMASRKEPPDSLDFFPTPPWATRALCVHVLSPAGLLPLGAVWEPACGQGHMADALAEYATHVFATDIFDYGYTDTQIDFLGEFGSPAIEIDWIITNPPFNTAIDFALKALPIARAGVALLCRNQWIEGAERYRSLFALHPPLIVAPFVERVPMVKGRWDPAATTATAYSWFVWHNWTRAAMDTRISWIPPGCRRELTFERDISKFAVRVAAPLLDKARA